MSWIWLCAVSTLVAAPGAWAGSVSGSFVLNGKALTPAEAAAFRTRDQADASKEITLVMLTAKPLDLDGIVHARDPYTTAINDPAASGDHLTLSVRADGTVGLNANVGGVQYLDSSGRIMGEKGSLEATCTANTPAHVACAVKTVKEVQTPGGARWTLDVTFESDVASRPKGKPIAAGGEAPGQALLALSKALGGEDLPSILALLKPDDAETYKADWRSAAENLEAAKDMLGRFVPKQPKIRGGEWVADDHARLEVEGVPFEGVRMLYIVDMIQVDGRWVYDRSTTAGMLD
jgi:hypothetical protein